MDVDALTKGAGKRKIERERQEEQKAKATGSRAMPKTATGKKAGQKQVTNKLMAGQKQVTNMLMGGGKRQIGRQELVQNGGRQQNDWTLWETEEPARRFEINNTERCSSNNPRRSKWRRPRRKNKQ